MVGDLRDTRGLKICPCPSGTFPALELLVREMERSLKVQCSWGRGRRPSRKGDCFSNVKCM